MASVTRSPLRVLFALLLAGLLSLAGVWCQAPAGGRPLWIALTVPLTGRSASSGEAIQRGMQLAIEEVNRTGGVFGRPLRLVTRDVQGGPTEGAAALRELAERHELVATFGGVSSPVMLGQLATVHELQIPLINPWGSIPEITRNGYAPNYAFSVSAIDRQADEFLIRYVHDVLGARRPGLLADTTAWGDSNVAGLVECAAELGDARPTVARFQRGDSDPTAALQRLRAEGVDALVMATNAPDGGAIARGLAALGWRVPLVSHWGIGAAEFVSVAGIDNAEGVLTLQTFSFHGPRSARAEALLQAYHARYGTRRVEEIAAPVGVAEGYDGVQLLARAIRQAGSSAGPRVRDALEQLEPYDGAVKRYAPAFSPERHDALQADDYLMAVWQRGQLVPAPRPRLTP